MVVFDYVNLLIKIICLVIWFEDFIILVVFIGILVFLFCFEFVIYGCVFWEFIKV